MFPADESECSESDVSKVCALSSDAVHLWQIPARRRIFLPLSAEIQLRSTSRLRTPTSLLECCLYEVRHVSSVVMTLILCLGWPLESPEFTVVKENYILREKSWNFVFLPQDSHKIQSERKLGSQAVSRFFRSWRRWWCRQKIFRMHHDLQWTRCTATPISSSCHPIQSARKVTQ